MELRKWSVVGLLSLGMVIAYVDRANLSVVLATSQVRDAFQLGDAGRGLLNSAFFWTYAILQIPAGWVVDRFGVKRPYAIAFLAWTLISAATGMVNSVSQLLVLRLLLGAGESVCAPASLRWIGWNCPEERRGLAIGIYMAGTKIGAAIGVPVAAFLVMAYSWRSMFVMCGLAGLIWVVAWLFLANDAGLPIGAAPAEDESPALTKLLRSAQGNAASRHSAKELACPSGGALDPAPVVRVFLRSRLTWGILIGTFCYGYFLYFCVTWLPAYLVEYRHLALDSMGFYTLFSFGGMAVVAILAGWLADWLIRQGMDPARTRKGFTVLGFLLASTEVFGAFAHSQKIALFFTVFSLAGLGLATANYWALTQTLIPGRAMGRMAGVQNCASNLGGVAAPIVTGWLKQTTGSYQAPMQAIWLVLVIGVASYVFLVRRPATSLVPHPSPTIASR